MLVDRAHAAAEWLLRSIAVCGGQGSSVYYSRWYKPLRGWHWPYPETTGYIIPTLIRYGEFAGRPGCIELAVRQADWIISLQYDNGVLPGGHVTAGRKEAPSVFNTAQMVLGLIAAADQTREEKYLHSAGRAAAWLAAELDPSTGTWTAHSYVRGYSPAYYTRVCWPMLEVHARAPDQKIRAAALHALRTIADWQIDNGAIRNWGFRPDAPAFTHTIAYTLRGFLENARQIPSQTVAAASRHVGATHVKVADLNTPRALAVLHAARVDLVVYAGGGILRRAFIDTPPLGVLNTHGGPPPAFRGMSVAEWALFHGVRPEVSVHYIDEGIDTGPVVLHRPIPRDAWSSVPHLRGVAARVSVEALLEAVERIAEGRIEAQPQRLSDGRQFFVMAEPLLDVLESWLAHDRTPVMGADEFAFHRQPPMAARASIGPVLQETPAQAARRPRERHGGGKTL